MCKFLELWIFLSACFEGDDGLVEIIHIVFIKFDKSCVFQENISQLGSAVPH